ncbi:MAG: deoxyribodipyrimidine photo-lyase [Bacteroidota bacterium]
MKKPVCIFWFRRDLRLEDNAGLYNALNCGIPVLPIFIFDKSILDQLEDKSDRRVTFIYRQLALINIELQKHNASLKIFYDTPQAACQVLFKEFDVKAIYTNCDYEPYAKKRDAEIEILCVQHGIDFIACKDQVIFEKDEIVKDDETPYTIFTPYSKKWKLKFRQTKVQPFNSENHCNNFFKKSFSFPSLKSIGFEVNTLHLPGPQVDKSTILNYHINRDFPFPGKTTHVSLHLRFGTISIRQLAILANKINEKYLDELIWREFFMQVLWHFPQVVNHPFKRKYENIKWRNDEKEFEKWCNGETGFPIVDAGMRELNETGFMHNRVRMIVANFLTKILLIDWRWGETYFAQKLADFELSSNNGNWQWAAGCGCDAAPYFRIFNPLVQAERFDPENKYISKWIPEFKTNKYLKPMIDFNFARKKSLELYKEALS